MSNEKYREMGQHTTGSLLFRYALPAIAVNILTTAYNIVDRIVVGQATGTTGLAAMTVAIPFLMFGAAAAGLANAGGGSLISRRLGAGDRSGAERALAQAVLSGFVLNTLTALLLWPLIDPILYWFGASSVTAEPAKRFAVGMLAGYPLQGACQGLFAGLRSQGRVAANLLFASAVLLANTALCVTLVFGAGMGTAGSAWAIFGANALGVLLLWRYYRHKNSSLVLAWRHFKINWQDQAEIARAGMGSWLGNTLPAGLILIVNNLMARHAGDTGLALIGIVHVIGLMAFMPVSGVMQAAGPLISFNHGNGQSKRVWRVFHQSLAVATGILTVFWLPIELIPGPFVAVFASGDTALVSLGQQTLWVFFLAHPLIGLTFIVSQYYQSIGKGLPSAINGVSRQIIFLIPLMLLMANLGGFKGFVWATPLADGLGAILSALFLIWEYRSVRKSWYRPAEIRAGE